MLKLGKIVASSALGLTMGLSLLAPSAFAQSATSSNADVSARTATATTAVIPLRGRVPAGGPPEGCGDNESYGHRYGGDGDGNCGGYYPPPRLRCENARVQVVVGVQQHGRTVWTRVWVTTRQCNGY